MSGRGVNWNDEPLKERPKNKRKKVSMIGYADVGSHRKVFEFWGGPVGDRYPHLLHIYSKKVTPDLVKVRIEEV